MVKFLVPLLQKSIRYQIMHICMLKIFFTYMNGTMAQLLVPLLPEVHSVTVHHYYRENTHI